MEKNIILVDFENMQYLDPSDLKEDTKILVFIGHNQTKKSINFTMENIEKVSSIELIKIKRDINVEQKNALDFFIAHYLGIFIEKHSLLNLNYIIYSDDHGFDPLIKHLKGNNIQIKREDKKILSKKTKIVKKEVSTKIKNTENDDTNEITQKKYYEKIIRNLKKTDKNKRPKTQKGLNGHINTFLPGKIENRETIIKKIMEIIIENEIIILRNNKITYNM